MEKKKEKEIEKENEKENEKKETNIGKIVVCIIMVIALCISIAIVLPIFTTNKEDYQKQYDEVVDEINTLEARNNEIFRTEGLTKEYYDNESKIQDLTDEKWDLERKKDGNDSFMRIPLAIIPLFFGGAISMMAYNIINRKEIMNEHYEHMEKIGKSIGEGYAEATTTPGYVPLKCPQCGANLKGEKIEKCPYCDTVLEKVRKK